MNDRSHVVAISKQRWDRLLLPIAAISTVAATSLGLLAGFWQGLQVPGLTMILWMYLRFTTPTNGMPAVSINGNPKVKALLKWLLFILVVTGSWALVDTQLLGNSIYAPLSSIEIVAFIALVVLLLAGVLVIERRFPSLPTDANTTDNHLLHRSGGG